MTNWLTPYKNRNDELENSSGYWSYSFSASVDILTLWQNNFWTSMSSFIEYHIFLQWNDNHNISSLCLHSTVSPRLIETRMEEGEELFRTFIDLKAAFDTVNREEVWSYTNEGERKTFSNVHIDFPTFIDLKAALETINREEVWSYLEEIHVLG